MFILNNGESVIRGPTWSWQSQDIDRNTGQSMIGRVLRKSDEIGWYIVNWSDGSTNHYRYNQTYQDIVPILVYDFNQVSSLEEIINSYREKYREKYKDSDISSQIARNIGCNFLRDIQYTLSLISSIENNEIDDVTKIIEQYEKITHRAEILSQIRSFLIDQKMDYFTRDNSLWYIFIILGQEDKSLEYIDENAKVEEYQIRRLLENHQYSVLERLFQYRPIIRIIYSSIGLRLRINRSYQDLPRQIFFKMRQFLMLEGYYNIFGNNYEMIDPNNIPIDSQNLSKYDRIRKKYLSYRNWLSTHLLYARDIISEEESCAMCQDSFGDQNELILRSPGKYCSCYYHQECATHFINTIIDNLNVDQDTQINRVEVCCINKKCQQEVRPSFIYCLLLINKYPEYALQSIHLLMELNDDMIYERLDEINSKFIAKMSRYHDIIRCPTTENCRGLIIADPRYQEMVKCTECLEETMVTGRLKALEDQKDSPEIQELLKNSNFGFCPTCNKLIEKNGGCTDMYCTFCRKNFTWKVSEDGSYSMSSTDKKAIHF